MEPLEFKGNCTKSTKHPVSEGETPLFIREVRGEWAGTVAPIIILYSCKE